MSAFGANIGHWHDVNAKTGVTAIIFDKPSTASVHVAGGAPGTQETDLLDPSCLVNSVDAIVLTGGSAFGLASVVGVRRYLEEKGRGFDVAGVKVPIVPAAVIFDLGVGSPDKRPGPEEGYMACVNSEKSATEDGAIGAGCGATVGKYMGSGKSSQGGLASSILQTQSGATITAIMVANCFGAVVDPETGKTVAGPKDDNGAFISYLNAPPTPPRFGATSIGVVTTDIKLSKADAKRVAIMAHDGLARTVYPCHTPYDGDAIFVVSTGDRKESVSITGAWAAKAVERAMISAVS
ncbi:hypothetical protein MNBD_NITROSPINAE01-436 [hydrothermal vent metagenome]|uniref:Endo-type 6-aminohexanoate oligomer hydrolase n=1 Tax=hydrothermal vent metagenome TaxID=652676 RepID=A0A3B1BU46_9ZZZZ